MAPDLQAEHPDRKSARILIALSLALFVASLAFPAWHDDDNRVLAGWSALISGWIPACWNLLALPHGDFGFVTTIAWFANPLLLGCWLLAGHGTGKMGVVFGAAAFGLSLVFLTCHDLSLPDNHMTGIVPGLGYATWVASIVTALLGASLSEKAGSRSSPRKEDARGDRSETSAVREALEQFRQGMTLSARCPACRKRLTARRTSSATSAVPDIEIACPCGACSERHSFRPVADQQADGETLTV